MKRLLLAAFALCVPSFAQAQTSFAKQPDVKRALSSGDFVLLSQKIGIDNVTGKTTLGALWAGFPLTSGAIAAALGYTPASTAGGTFTGNINIPGGFAYQIGGANVLGGTGASPVLPAGPLTLGHAATTMTTRSLMAVDNLLENNSVFPLVNSGREWDGGTYSYFGVSRVFDGTTGSGTGGPVNTHMDVAVNNGTLTDPVASMSYCRVVANSGAQHCFGGNDVVTASVGTTPQLIGREIDVQTDGSSIHPTAVSGGLFINFFNSPFAGARGILVNTLNGGSLDTGLQIAGTITGNQIVGTGFSIDPTNNFKTTGSYKTSGYQAIGNNQGSYLAWNKSGGLGETDFINHQGGGSAGGWFWSNTTDGTTFTPSANLTPTGTMNLASGGSYQINGTSVLGLSGSNPQLPTTTVVGSNPVATRSGTLTNGHCVSIDSTGNFVDAGGTCTTGGGGGTVNSGGAGQLAYYAGAGSAVSGLTTGTGIATALGVNAGSAGSVVVNGGALGTPSSGTINSGLLASGAAVANLGFTPANKAGDSFTGDVAVGRTATASTTSPLQVAGDATLWSGTASLGLNSYFAGGGFKAGATGYGQWLKNNNDGRLQLYMSPSSASAGAALTMNNVVEFDGVSQSVNVQQGKDYRKGGVTITPWLNVRTDFGASGSGATTTGSITSGSNTLTLATAQDFANGQGIMVFGAGSTFAIPQGTSQSAAQNGTTGSTRYDYKIAMLDYAGGVGVPIIATVTNANAALNTTNNVSVNVTPGAGYAGYAVWKSTNSGSYVYIGVSTLTTFTDTGWVPDWRPAQIPASPPSVAQNDWLVTAISVGAGTTTLTLGNNAANTVSGAFVQHDDTAAFNAAVAKAQTTVSGNKAAPGADIIMPCGQYNVSGIIQVTAGSIGFSGEGPCTIINGFGANTTFFFNGPSSSVYMFGNWLKGFYQPSYNMVNGRPLQVQYAQNFTYEDVFVDHPYQGVYFHDVNDVRWKHWRMTARWGQGTDGWRIDSGSGAGEYACCFMMQDVYENALSTVAGGNGMRTGSNGGVIDGNVATVIGYNVAISNIEGNGLTIGNFIGHPTGVPEFIQMTDFGSEFSNGRAIDIEAGSEMFFTNSILHDAGNAGYNKNHNVYIANGAHSINFTGGRNGNATGNNYEIAGQNISISGQSIINGSYTNSGTYNGIVLDPTASNISITGNRIGLDYGVSWHQNYPVYVNAGADKFTITGNTFDGNLSNFVYMGNVGYAASRKEEANTGNPAPVIASGFGTSPSVNSSNGVRAFRVVVGTGGAASTGTITMPLDNNGWYCQAQNYTTPASTTRMSGITTSSVAVTNYNAAGSVAAWAAGDVLAFTCQPG